MSNKKLLIPILIFLNFGFALPAFGQNTGEIENLLNECEVIIGEVADQRDQAIQEADKASQERDEARGQLLFVVPQYDALKDENRKLIRLEADKPSRLTWMAVGAGGTVIITLIGILVVTNL